MNEKRLKNLLAKMIYKGQGYNDRITCYEMADIPTRETVDEFLPKIIKQFNK